MTEEEWLACTDPTPMLEFVRRTASKRKLMLFACACCYRIWDLLPRKESRQAVEMAALYADGLADSEDLEAAAHPANEIFRRIKHPAKQAAAHAASNIGMMLRMTETSTAIAHVAYYARNARQPAVQVEDIAQSVLLRCIFHYPNRSVSLASASLTDTVSALAQATYDKRILPAGHLEPDRLAVLSDALEDAGCTDADILGHLREPGTHVRGCWVVDLLLGRQ